MTTYSNDPIRVKITLDDIWNLTHKPGIDSTFHPSGDQPDEYYLKLATSDIDPHNPSHEHYKEELDKELEKFNIIQDRIRTYEPYSHFNPNKNIVKETILDEKVFAKDNRYDILIDKFQKSIHLLPNSNGKRFITVEDS